MTENQGVSSMSSVVDFLEKMGSEAHWRDASPQDIELALAEADIDASMSAAILAQSASEVRALLGQAACMGMLIPGPSPEEAPDQPEPEKRDDEEEGEESILGASSSRVRGSAPVSSTNSLL
jgi:hypothetical protein